MKTAKLSFLALAALMMGLASCEKDSPEEVTPVVTKTDSIRVTTNARSGHYSFYSFKEGKEIDLKDSATTKWDIGIRLATIITNSGESGPGTVGVVTEKGVFETYAAAPASGYAYDTTSAKLAINSSFNGGWYTYDPATHAFSPKAGMFFVVKTSDNKYVKVEMLSARYEDFVGPMPQYVWHKFRYVYQPDGSQNFK